MDMRTRSTIVDLHSNTSVRLLPVNHDMSGELGNNADGVIDDDDDKDKNSNKDDNNNSKDTNNSDSDSDNSKDEYKEDSEDSSDGERMKKSSNDGQEDENEEEIDFENAHKTEENAEDQGPESGINGSEGIVTLKSSEVVLGHILKHVEQCMATLNKTIISINSRSNRATGSIGCNSVRNMSSNHSDRSPHGAVENVKSLSGYQIIGDENEDGESSSNSFFARQICQCIFTLFEPHTMTPTELAAAASTSATSSFPSSSPSPSTSFPSSTTSNTHSRSLSAGSVRQTASVLYTSTTTPTTSTAATTLSSGLKMYRKNGHSSSACTNIGTETLVPDPPVRPLMLKNVSERRRGQVLSMATRYLSHCNRGCARLLREILAISKERTLRENIRQYNERSEKRGRERGGNDMWENPGTGSGKRKKGSRYESSEEDDDMSDDGASDSDGEKGGHGLRKRRANNDGDKDSSSCNIDNGDGSSQDRGYNPTAGFCESILGSGTYSRPGSRAVAGSGPKTGPHSGMCSGPGSGIDSSSLPSTEKSYGGAQFTREEEGNLSESAYCFLEAILSVAAPSVIISAKEWIVHKTSSDNNNIQQSASGESDSKRQRASSNASSAKNVKNSKNSIDIPSGAPSDKHAHALTFKLEELEWRLLLLIQELDRARSTTRKNVSYLWSCLSLSNS